jgi:hypothetical protein
VIYRWRAFLVLIVVLYLLLGKIPAPPHVQNDTGRNRQPPKHHVETKPRFLYRSHFRQNPDLEKQSALSEALQSLEKQTLKEHASDGGMVMRIWQIMLQQSSNTEERNPYSILFQEYNSEWISTVCSSLT